MDIDTGSGKDFDGAAASDTTYVVVGESGKIYSSPGGAPWTERTAPYTLTTLNLIEQISHLSGHQSIHSGSTINVQK